MSFRQVSSLKDIWSGEMMGLVIDGMAILLVNVDDQVHAYADVCPHQKSRLSQGCLTGNTLRCARHQWEFNVCTGQGINPRSSCLKEFPLRVEGDDILLDLDEAFSLEPEAADVKEHRG